MDPSAVHHRTCNLGEAMYGLRIELDSERIRSIRGDCPKATALEVAAAT